jgi:hypothetical protein
MNSNQARQPGVQLNRRQVVAGAVLMGVGGVIALAGVALAGTALVSAFRQRVQQMDVPPGELARQHLSAVRQATSAGMDVWLKEQPGSQRQPVAQR